METSTSYPTIITERKRIPNIQPVRPPSSLRLALVGDSPSQHDEDYGYPFCGPAGNFLNHLLNDVGIDRNQCLVANLNPTRNETSTDHSVLCSDINLFNPNLVVLFGQQTLSAAKDKAELADWRGSLFVSQRTGPFSGRKCIATYHPIDILREYESFPLLKFDLGRARQEAENPALTLPIRELLTDLPAGQLVHMMDNWKPGVRCSVDIEGGLPADSVNDGVKKDSKRRRYIGWRCVALSASPSKAFAIAWWKFNDVEFALVYQSFAKLMLRADVPKVLQNSLYDAFVLAYGYHIPIVNVTEDTMLKSWEQYCELPKGLSTIASIYTREPHWKDEGMYQSTSDDLALGCCKDVAVTLEICNALDSILKPNANEHYRKNMDLLRPALYMELRGIKYDLESVAEKTVEVRNELLPLGKRLSELANQSVLGPSGCIADKRLGLIMYDKLGYPKQFKKEHGRLTNKYTTDIDALLKLRRKLPTDEFLNGVIKHRHLEGVLETLRISADPDGRVRCAYNVVGTETGRFSCKTSPTGAGANLTTITKKLRHNYIADTDFDFFQCDLSGADGWTVAAWCAKLGDPTMLDDYNAGLKPAKIIALLYDHGSDINKLDRDSLKNACRSVLDNWLYAGAKVVQHGTNYGMAVPTMITNLMKRSFKDSGEPIYMDPKDAAILQRCYLSRYPGVTTWQSYCQSQLVANGLLTSASGHTRMFFGRRFGTGLNETHRQYLAHEPQNNTTWATSLAMLNLWNDPDNRRPDGTLIIEPLHQVHDALCGQWPSSCRDWAKTKVRTYFNNSITIAGQSIVIPFEGGYGPSWGELKEKL